MNRRLSVSSVLLAAALAACSGDSNPTTDAAVDVPVNTEGGATDVPQSPDVQGPDVQGMDVQGTDVQDPDVVAPDVVQTDVVQPDVPGTDGGALMFPEGTICNNSGAPRTPPATLAHVILILMENKGYASIHGNTASAPYINSLLGQCGYSSQFIDNVFTQDLVSLPHYLALTSGSNCNTGLGTTTQTPGATGCITDDGDATAHRLSVQSVFNQVSSWRAYQENMPSMCAASSSGSYQTKHNPPPYYSALPGCAASDVAIAHINCPLGSNTVCATPDNAFTRDLANDTLAAYTFVTPDQINDMHDGTVAQGDNWLHTYLPRIFASPAYRRGEVAIYVMWDESTGPATAQPNLFISPWTAPTHSTATINLFSVLRATERQLGITTFLGCAGGMPPGGIGTCPTGSTADLRAIFNF